MKYWYIVIAIAVVAVIAGMYWYFNKKKPLPATKKKTDVPTVTTSNNNSGNNNLVPGTAEYNNAFANADLLGNNSSAPQANYVSNNNNPIVITPVGTPLNSKTFLLGNINIP